MRRYILLGIVFLLLLFILITGHKKTIVGRWKSFEAENEYYYIFNSDKTCAYEMLVARLNCTYEDKDSKLIITYDGESEAKTYKYRFEKDKLIIIDTIGNEHKFIKQK